MSDMHHTLDTYNEIARELQYSYYMRAEDVDGAFPVIPLAPRVWKYMYVHWFNVNLPLEGQKAPNTLYIHVLVILAPIWDKFFRYARYMG